MAMKRYKNISNKIVAGAKPGEEFEFDYSVGYNEQALIDGGFIVVVSDKPSPQPDGKKEG